jgi:hypothetical protein
VQKAVAALPKTVKTVMARADSGFYGWETVEAYESCDASSFWWRATPLG